MEIICLSKLFKSDQIICRLSKIKAESAKRHLVVANETNNFERYSFWTNHSLLRHRNQPMRIVAVTCE